VTTSTARRGVRGNYVRGIAAREAIVDAAREVLVERGFHGASMRAIAERCGMSTSGVLHHFESKKHLLAAVMDGRFRENREWFSAQIDRDRDILDVVVELVGRQLERPAASTLLVVLSADSIDPEHPAHGWYIDRYNTLRAALSDRVSIDQARDWIRADVNADDVAVQLLATMEGLLLQWLNNRDAIDPVAVMQGLTDRLRRV
jgi:AcrR family transcriptional regulator